MKKHLLIIFLALSQIAFSQTLEMPNFPDGVIIYDVSIKINLLIFQKMAIGTFLICLLILIQLFK